MVLVCALYHRGLVLGFPVLRSRGRECGAQAGQAEACSAPEVPADTLSSSCLMQEGDEIQAKPTYPSPPRPFRDSVTASSFLANSPAQFQQLFKSGLGAP